MSEDLNRRMRYLFFTLPRVERLKFVIKHNLVEERDLDAIPVGFWDPMFKRMRDERYFTRKLERRQISE